ncbi:hypothetical protein HYW35_01640 [Candidatus Saccharibacteria bacterium]|nr:hypothetical protein [Candidatus Saccharibacteria bacterium]
MIINKDRSNGFISATAFVVLIVVAGLIAGTGWYVGHRNKSATKTENTSKSNTNTQIPAGWTSYENKELGFKFAYPKEWGSVSVNKIPGYSLYSYGRSSKVDGTLSVNLIFSGNDKVEAYLHSVNFVPAPRGGAAFDIVSFCKIGSGYGLSFTSSIKVNEAGDYKASGQAECPYEPIKEEIIPISDQAILIPKICRAEVCSEDSNYSNYYTILIIQTSLKEYPGLKFIDKNRQSVEVLKKIPSTYQNI